MSLEKTTAQREREAADARADAWQRALAGAFFSPPPAVDGPPTGRVGRRRLAPALPTQAWLAIVTYACGPVWGALLMLSFREAPALLPMLALAWAAPVIAYGVFRVRRWGFYALQAHAAVAAIVGILLALLLPDFAWINGVIAGQWALAAAGLWSQNARARYLGETRRGFRRHRRFASSLHAALHGAGEARAGEARAGHVADLSIGGAYVQLDPSGLAEGARVKLEITLKPDVRLLVSARVVRVAQAGPHGEAPPGVGLAFYAVSRAQHEALVRFIQEGRRELRTPVALPIRIAAPGRVCEAETADVSLSGCFVEARRGGAENALPSAFHPGDRLSLEIDLGDGEVLETFAEVVWVSDVPVALKPNGIAVRFTGLNRADRARLKTRLGAKH